MCRCPSVWDSSPDEPIYEQFTSAQVLLDRIASYYPAKYNEFNLDQAVLLGRGADAYVFLVNNEVVKFTQNLAHAKVSLELSKTRYSAHLVSTYSCHELVDLGLWCITEERLEKLDPLYKGQLCDFLEHGDIDPAVELDVANVILDLDALGVMEWREDCVSAHNLMTRPSKDFSSPELVAFDFGYTHAHFSEDFPSW